MKKNNSKSISLLMIIASLLLISALAGMASAKDILPKAVGHATLVSGPGAGETPSQGLPATQSVSVPFLTPFGSEKYRLLKQQASGAPAAEGADILKGPSGPQPLSSDVVTSFIGLDRLTATNNGFIFVPPDTIVSKSNTRVIEATNSALRMFTTAGAVSATVDLNTFFGASPGVPVNPSLLMFDPKVYYDRTGTDKRFYIIGLQGKPTTPGVSTIWLAVSRSSNPADFTAANWCRYIIDGTWPLGSGTTWADYPGLGLGTDTLVISTNQFTFGASPTFTFAVVRAMNKLTLANNAAACPAAPTVFTFQPSATTGNGTIFTLQPAQHYSAPSSFTAGGTTTNPLYLINTDDTVPGTADYHVWRVKNVAGGTPVMNSATVTGTFTYGIPPSAPQSGSAVLLDTGDLRMTQVAGLGNNLFGVHGTVCNFGGGANESCGRYVRIGVGQNATTGALTAALGQQRTFGGGANIFYFMPGIAVNNRSQVIVPFQRSSAASFLSAWWTMKDTSVTQFESASPLTTGTCSQTAYTRTGDYVGAQTDPSDFSSFWIAGERATTVGAGCDWQTQIMKVTPGTEIGNL